MRIRIDFVTDPDPDQAPNLQSSGSCSGSGFRSFIFFLKKSLFVLKNLTCRCFSAKYLHKLSVLPFSSSLYYKKYTWRSYKLTFLKVFYGKVLFWPDPEHFFMDPDPGKSSATMVKIVNILMINSNPVTSVADPDLVGSWTISPIPIHN